MSFSGPWLQFIDDGGHVVVINLAHVISVVHGTVIAPEPGKTVTQILTTEVIGGDCERHTLDGDRGDALWRQFRKLAGLTEDL